MSTRPRRWHTPRSEVVRTNNGEEEFAIYRALCGQAHANLARRPIEVTCKRCLAMVARCPARGVQ